MSVRTLHYRTAEKFLDALSPIGKLLGRAPIDHLIFRGQRRCDWPLLPSIFREGVAVTNAEQVRKEATALRDFLHFSDRQGLPIPSDSDVLRRDVDEAADSDSFLRYVRPGRDGLVAEPVWPKRQMRPLMALSQHHGLPTRMLDWTRHPLVAAYFAARASARDPSPAPLAVVVFDVPRARSVMRLHHQGSLAVVEVPYASNANARAQHGLFTVESRAMLVPDGSVDTRPIEDWFASTKGGKNPLFKVLLPSSEAGRLLALLARHNITAATMFPGYDGVVRALAERALWK